MLLVRNEERKLFEGKQMRGMGSTTKNYHSSLTFVACGFVTLRLVHSYPITTSLSLAPPTPTPRPLTTLSV
jgi:hypothetical protein